MSSVFRHMQATFALFVVFPPPASRTFRFAGLDGAGAGLAADRRIAAGVERIDGNILGRHMGTDRLDIPVGQRVDLQEVALGVVFGKRRCGPVAGLSAAKPGDPHIGAGKRLCERHELAHMTASMAGFDADVKAVCAMFRSIGIDIVLFVAEELDRDAVALLRFRDQLRSLGNQPAGIGGRY